MTRSYRGNASLPPGPARDLVELLRRLQQYRGLSVGQIAVKAGLSRSHVSEVLRGWKTPSPAVAASIVRALGGSESESSNARQWAGQAREVRQHLRARGAPSAADPGLANLDGHVEPAPVITMRVRLVESESERVVPRELPSAVPGFTGRSAELDALTGMLDEASAETPGTVVISAIGGTAGVGKTALALRWAQQVAGRFPDGQLYVNLRGYDPSQPMPAADALAAFLRSLGVHGQAIPPEENERAARYRSLLAPARPLPAHRRHGDGRPGPSQRAPP